MDDLPADEHPSDPSAADRIERAIARIERAVAVRAADSEALAKRHAALKARMAEAVSALDEVIARTPATPASAAAAAAQGRR